VSTGHDLWTLRVRSCAGLYVPRQELFDAIDGVIGDLGEYGAEIALRVKAVKPGATDQRVDGGGAMTAGIGPSKKIVPPS
jgi:hypothetical protein